MQRALLTLAVLGLALLQVACGSSAQGSDGATPGSAYAAAGCGEVTRPPADLAAPEVRTMMLCLHNWERGKAGLGALGPEPLLELSATQHSEDMVARDYFEHTSLDGKSPQDRIQAALYQPTGGWTGENIAWGEGSRGSVAALMESWMNSPGHKENILRPGFTEVGFGIAWGGPGAKPGHAKGMTLTANFGG